MIKWIVVALTALGMVIGGVYFWEDRYFKTSDAKELKAAIEKESVETFQQQQQYTDTKQEKIELEILDILKDELYEIERKIEESPASIYLKNKYNKLKSKIQRMENKLYK
jgi:predicted lipid-binding transport protein (Tim44 family)